MRPILLAGIMLPMTFASPGQAHAQAQYARERSDVRYVLRGATIVLRRHYDINADCTSAPVPQLRIVTAPQLGRLLARIGTRNPIQSTNPSRVACNKVRVQTLEVSYRAATRKRGEDRVAYDLVRRDGRLWREEFVVHVE